MARNIGRRYAESESFEGGPDRLVPCQPGLAKKPSRRSFTDWASSTLCRAISGSAQRRSMTRYADGRLTRGTNSSCPLIHCKLLAPNGESFHSPCSESGSLGAAPSSSGRAGDIHRNPPRLVLREPLHGSMRPAGLGLRGFRVIRSEDCLRRCTSSSSPGETPPMNRRKSSKRRIRGVLVGVLCQRDFLARIDTWRAKQPAPFSRAQAIRWLVEMGRRAAERRPNRSGLRSCAGREL
jgi:hypothetical protein